MEKFYLRQIEQNDPNALYDLGRYYEISHNYPNMIKYYLLSIEKHNNTKAMFNLGTYYETIEDYPNMIKYYLLSIEHDNNIDAMFNLGLYYDETQDYPNAIKYYLMTIENPNNINNIADVKAMNNLGVYYYNNKDFRKMEKYYLMAIKKNYIISKHNLEKYYQEVIEYDSMALIRRFISLQQNNIRLEKVNKQQLNEIIELNNQCEQLLELL